MKKSAVLMAFLGLLIFPAYVLAGTVVPPPTPPPAPIPEPGTFLLVAAGVAGLVWGIRRKKQ
jgi:hypothetical protein